MANESDKKPTLTINDPIEKATLKRIGELQTRRYQLGDMLLELEQEKVKILVEGRRVDDERQKIFTAALTARGLQPNMPVEVDPETGKINLIKMNGQGPSPAPEAAAPEAPPAQA